jgi:hypothetical protein
MPMRTRILKLSLFLLLAIPHFAEAQYVPPSSPSYQIRRYVNEPGCEYLFMAIFRLIAPSPRKVTNMMLDRTGDLVWYHQGTDWSLDFKVHPNGMMAYSDGSHWHILDSTFTEVDSLWCDGRPTDDHDLIMTADGHYYMLCWQDSTMDLSGLKTKNGTTGSVQGRVDALIIQELDPNKQLVREWNSFNHFSIYDSDTVFFTNPNRLELTHSNSLDLDANGNLLVSHRHLNEVTLIDWQSGQIKWHLSGKNNDFDLLGDPGFFGQHDARFLPGGRISVFDNGSQRHPGRGVVMQLDTVNWTATVEKSFGGSLMSTAMGSFRYFPDNKGLVNLGVISPSIEPVVTYYAADSTKIFDLQTSDDTYATYRAQCMDLPFDLNRPAIHCFMQSGQAHLGVDGVHGEYEWTNGEVSPSILVTDTGRYQVFVPYGIGMISSPPVYITDVQNACASVPVDPKLTTQRPSAILIGRYDLLGKPANSLQAHQILIERYSDGTFRKIFPIQ